MFANKVVIITGSSSGIGAHAAVEFAKQGACVVLHGRNSESLTQVRMDCLADGKVESDKLKILRQPPMDFISWCKAHIIKCSLDNESIAQISSVMGDICDDSVQNQLLITAMEKYGRIDVLVNNAGTMKPTPIKDFDMTTFNATVNVNFTAVVSLTMKCLPYLISTKGCIINVSSNLSTRPLIGVMGYCVSKTALDGFTRALAAEVATLGVRVNSVNPGPVPTNITRECNPPRDYKDTPRTIPMSRYGTTIETSKAILFLASDQSSYTTGHMLMVDGGLCLSALNVDLS